MSDKFKPVAGNSGKGPTSTRLVDMGDGTWAEKVVAVNADGSAIGGGGGGSGGAVTIADGANVTQGAKADAVATTSTGSWSIISLLKAIFASLIPGTFTAITGAQLTAGTAFVLPNVSGLQLQFNGISADSLLVEHTADGTNWKTALLARQDATAVTLVSGAGLTGATANAIYTLPMFGGQFRITRTGTADASLTAGYRGTK